MSFTPYIQEDENCIEDDDEETISTYSSLVSDDAADNEDIPHSRAQRCSLTRSDGREAVFGQMKSPTSPDRRGITREAGLSLLISPRARELRRRRPAEKNSAIPPRAPVFGSVMEDSSSESMDQAPARPRREKSRDQDSWPNVMIQHKR